jgi:Domain of unknown function (DUF4143)
VLSVVVSRTPRGGFVGAVVGWLLRAVGATSAAELNVERLSTSLGTPATTIRRHIELLKMLFLIRRLPAWSNNLLARSIKRTKVHVADTGLLAYLVGADERGIDASVPSKSIVAWVPSQKGLLEECPQRHITIGSGCSITRPSTSVSATGPETMYGPFSPGVMLTSAMGCLPKRS